MKVGGEHFRTIWLKPTDDRVLQLIDQRFLPHQFVIEEVRTVAQMAEAIREMHVRGAGLIGAAAAYGIYLATLESAGKGAAELDLTNAAKRAPGHATHRGEPLVGDRSSTESDRAEPGLPPKRSRWRVKPPPPLPMKTRNRAGELASTD